MIVYHGTGDYALDPIRQKGLVCRRRRYTQRPAACTTTSLHIAKMFAIRKTSCQDYHEGRITGVVMEFELSGSEGRDYAPAVDPTCMHDEKEIAVFNVSRLRLVAVWRCNQSEWHREAVGERIILQSRRLRDRQARATQAN
jgi:hypothetical protein